LVRPKSHGSGCRFLHVVTGFFFSYTFNAIGLPGQSPGRKLWSMLRAPRPVWVWLTVYMQESHDLGVLVPLWHIHCRTILKDWHNQSIWMLRSEFCAGPSSSSTANWENHFFNAAQGHSHLKQKTVFPQLITSLPLISFRPKPWKIAADQMYTDESFSCDSVNCWFRHVYFMSLSKYDGATLLYIYRVLFGLNDFIFMDNFFLCLLQFWIQNKWTIKKRSFSFRPTRPTCTPPCCTGYTDHNRWDPPTHTHTHTHTIPTHVPSFRQGGFSPLLAQSICLTGLISSHSQRTPLT